MRSKCPYTDCHHIFEICQDEENRAGPCPRCGRAISYRSARILGQIERDYARRIELGEIDPYLAWPVPSWQLSAVLEDVRSLWNVGSIFRTADAAGFSPLHLCGITGCPPRKEITKTSLGAEQSVRWSYHPGVLAVLPHLKADGVLIVGLERTTKSIELFQAIKEGLLSRPMSLVVGNEVTGVSPEALSFCEVVCHLAMRGSKESLNVAVAFGVAAYAISELVPQSSVSTA